MKANRFIPMLIIAALIAVTGLTFREAVATRAIVSEVNSATRSYSAWAQAVESEANSVDSATRSYTAWAQSIQTGLVPVTGSDACHNPAISVDVDSATRSYIAWAKSSECR